MTGEEFLTLWNCIELRQFIVDEAKKRGKTKEIQEDLVQDAWLLISTVASDCDIDSYKELAKSAINWGYWGEYRHYLLSLGSSR